MSSPSAEYWSLRKSLAFLAATFAILFGSLLPAAVAASPAVGMPVMLCSGDQALVVFDKDGVSKPATDPEMASLECAAALLSGLSAISPPPPPAARTPLEPKRVQQAPASLSDAPSLRRLAPRPPSTAPPRP